MLQDALPRDERGAPLAGCAAIFLDQELRLMSATDPSVDTSKLELDWIKESAREGEARVTRCGDQYHAIGSKPDTGYREYPGLGGYAVVLTPIGAVPQKRSTGRGALPQRTANRQDSIKEDVLEFATFAVGENWYATPTANVVEAIDSDALQTLPTGETWCAGYLMFRGEPIVVADMARLLGVAHTETARAVIVLRTPGQGKPFGILVEALGDIPEVARDRLLPIASLYHQQAASLVEYAIEAADPQDPLIMVLSIERLLALINGTALTDAAAVAA
jgi:chemotaxis signal transduction protein